MLALVVDDNPMIKTVLRPAFAAMDVDFDLAVSVSRAKELLAEERYDLAILDFYLPDGNGLDIARHMRATKRYATIPLIVLSSEASIASDVRHSGLSGIHFCDKMTGTAAVRDMVAAIIDLAKVGG